MSDLNTEINNYLRDAQYRTAELTGEIDDVKDDGGTRFEDKKSIRLQLSVFMDMLYASEYSFYEGYNFLQGGDYPWTDEEILREIEYLRDIGEMNEIPGLSFADYQQFLVMNIEGDGGSSTPGSGVSFPFGNQGDFIYYANAGNTPIATSFPIYAGHSSESIESYFLNRA